MRRSIIAIVSVVVLAAIVILFYMNRARYAEKPATPLPTVSSSSVSSTPSSNVSSSASSTSSSTSSITELQLPSLAELQDKTADWLTYANQKYGINIKYPSGWNHYDEKTFPSGVGGNLIMNCKANEIFYTNKPMDGPEDGALINVFFSDASSSIITKNSIANDLEKYNQWHIPHQTNTFSLSNGFEGAISAGQISEGRAQIGMAVRQINNKTFCIGWSLEENYQYSKSDYSNISYQNQFLPFLASFETTQ